MFKKRRPVAPHFRVPPPFNPLTGERKFLQQPPDLPRVTTMRVKEIYDDYLVCEGWDPDMHAYYKDHLVAKPMALRKNPVDLIVFPDTFEKPAGQAIVDQTDPPYFVGELIVAAKMMGITGGAVGVPTVDDDGKLLGPADETAPEEMPMEGMTASAGGSGESGTLGDGYPIYWLDLNVTGRTWRTERHFELKDALTPGGFATAHPLSWDSDASDWAVDTTAAKEFTVHDIWGAFRGRAKDAYTSPHDQGSRGVAIWNGERGIYQIAELTPHALMIRGKLTATLVTTDTTFTIDEDIGGVGIMQPTGGLITDQDPAGNITVYNIFSWAGDNNGACIAAWNENTDHWEALQVECPA